jgi:hypothetical protein
MSYSSEVSRTVPAFVIWVKPLDGVGVGVLVVPNAPITKSLAAFVENPPETLAELLEPVPDLKLPSKGELLL